MSGVEISKKLLLVNSLSSVGQRVISISVLFWLQQYFVRRLPTAEYDIYVVVLPLQLWVSMLSLFVGAGLGRYVTEAYARGDERLVTEIVSTMLPLSLLTALVMLLFGGAITWWIDVILEIPPDLVTDARLMFGILVTMLALRVAVSPFMVGPQVKQRFLVLNVVGLVTELAKVGILFALLFGVGARALWAVVAMVPAAALDMAFVWIYSRRLVPALRFDRRAIRRELVAPITSFGGWSFVARSAAILRETCAPVLLNNLAPIGAAGTYRLGSLVETKFFPLVLRPLSTALPALTAMHATGQDERLRRYYFRLSRYLLWIFLLVAVPAVVYRNEFWRLYLGSEKLRQFGGVALVMTLLFAKSFFVYAQPVVAQVALARARNRPMGWRVLTIELSTVLLTWGLVGPFQTGAVGAAAATLGVHAVLNPLLNWSFGLRLTNARLGDFLRTTLGRGLVPAAVAVPFALVLHGLAPPPDWASLALSVLATCAVYAGVLVVFCLEPSERRDLRRVLERFGLRTRAGGAG